jgi:hypothetical protein
MKKIRKINLAPSVFKSQSWIDNCHWSLNRTCFMSGTSVNRGVSWSQSYIWALSWSTSLIGFHKIG